MLQPIGASNPLELEYLLHSVAHNSIRLENIYHILRQLYGGTHQVAETTS